MAQLVTLGETMAACSVLHPPARPSSVRSPRTSRKGRSSILIAACSLDHPAGAVGADAVLLCLLREPLSLLK